MQIFGITVVTAFISAFGIGARRASQRSLKLCTWLS